VIRSAISVGVAILTGACAAGHPVGTSVWTPAPGVAGLQRDAAGAAAATDASEAFATSSDTSMTDTTDSGGSADLSEAGPVPQSVLLIDEPPAHISHGSEPAMTRPVRARARRRPGKPYHPDPRIVIDVLDARGAAAADLQRTARDAGYWPFRRCYEDGLRRDQDLAGNVSLALAISPSGQVEQSAVTGGTLRDRTVMACVTREARQLSFASGTATVTAAAEVALATGDEPVAVSVPVARAEEIRQVLRTVWPAAQQCYSQALVVDPLAGGRIELRFRIDIHGEIAEVSPGSTRLAGSALGRCVLGTYQGLRLGLPEANHERHFVYALHFETDPMPNARERP
jgi:hypothetical protein